MKFLKSLKSIKAKVFIPVVASVAVMTGVAFAGWSPDRPIFDWNKPDDRKGSLDGPRINSFVNTPYYGDERAFFDARMQENTTGTPQDPNPYKDVLQGVNNGSHKVVLRTYIHNGANQDLNDDPSKPGNFDGVSVAKDLKIRVDLPTGSAEALRARSYVSISNPAAGYPAEVTDTTELVDVNGFSLHYEAGSARLYNGAHTAVTGGIQVPDSIVGSGATIGYDQMNGTLPGCFDYQTFVEITVDIVPSQSSLQKTVRKAGDVDYTKLATVAPGDTVQWMLRYDNKGSNPQDNVSIYDKLPAHLRVNPSSVRWIYKGVDGQDHDQKISDTDLFNKWENFGTWNSSTFFYLRFDTTALDDFDTCDVTLHNEARSKSDQLPSENNDTADVHIVKKNCNQTTPTYSCDLLTATIGANRSVKFAVKASAAGGATITRYLFNFGDSAPEFATTENVAEHTYAKDGQYAIHSQVEVRLSNGDLKTVSGDQCTTVVNFTTPPTKPPVTPAGKTTTLPNTGPGDVVALFFGVVTASTAAYYVVVRRYNV
jgi:uncharacterized repeat protein (TIGR01451 family)